MNVRRIDSFIEKLALIYKGTLHLIYTDGFTVIKGVPRNCAIE